jgi:uncharacterized protein (DUF952 family)
MTMTHAPDDPATTIYKICRASEWQEALGKGVYLGGEHDARDGFIHFSRAHQLGETARKHFAGQTDLVLLEIRAERLGPALREEPSRGGDLFPHLYGPLPADLVQSVWVLPWDGRAHVFPAGF